MSLSADEPAERDAVVDSGGSALESGDSSVFEAPLQGWQALADVVSDDNPDIAGLMVMGAHVIRAALEEEIPTLVNDLSEVLGLSESGLEEMSAALRADNLAFRSRALAEQMSEAYDDVVQGFRGGDQDPMRFIDEVIGNFVGSPLIRARGGDEKFNQVNNDVQQMRATGSFPRWTAACSLELPRVLGGRAPIYCARRGHRGWGAHLGALELSYGETTERGFEGRVVKAREQVGLVGLGGGYRDTLNEDFPSPFYGLIGSNSIGTDSPGVAGWAFALHLIEGPRREMWTRLADLLSRRRPQITAQIGALVQRSEQNVHNVLESAHIPLALAHPLIGLISMAAKAVVGFIVDALVKAWSETNLSTWTIWHTALIGSKQVPISVFTLTGRDPGSPGLRRLLGKDADSQPITDDEYDGDDRDPIQERQARFLIGPSYPESNLFDDKYFGAVAKVGRPLAWQEPLETGSGLRILVPHLDRSMDATDRASRAVRAEKGDEGLAARSKALYVSAIRADVQLRSVTFPAGDPNVKRRPRGQQGSFTWG